VRRVVEAAPHPLDVAGQLADAQAQPDDRAERAADDEPATMAELAPFADDGRAWVFADADDRPVAYLLVDVVDGEAHIEREWAVAHELTALSLTTYADVPWNGPYYARLGFEVVPPDRLAGGMRAIRAIEAAKGLDAWPRVVVRRRLPGAV
jgi:hypothetical protein